MTSTTNVKRHSVYCCLWVSNHFSFRSGKLYVCVVSMTTVTKPLVSGLVLLLGRHSRREQPITAAYYPSFLQLPFFPTFLPALLLSLHFQIVWVARQRYRPCAVPASPRARASVTPGMKGLQSDHEVRRPLICELVTPTCVTPTCGSVVRYWFRKAV